MSQSDNLQSVKNRTWFYEFDLPDGTRTKSDIPAEIGHIHRSRLDKLRKIISDNVPNASQQTAVDFASHEGFYSIELAKHFSSVRGLEIRDESMNAAKLMLEVLNVKNVTYEKADLQKLEYDEKFSADFVLVYGLMYHLENPIHTLRLASDLSRKHILIETQVFPYDILGKLEDGHYKSQRDMHGVFSLSVDYAKRREGGSTDIALVPSLNSLIFLMHNFGFKTVEVLKPDADDYEQFQRGSRVVVYGRK